MTPTPDFSPEAIAEAMREATPGPWHVEDNSDLPGDSRSVVDYHVVLPGNPWNHGKFWVGGGRAGQADAHLIANAPTWLAQLLAALEAERVARAETQQRLTAAQDLLDAVSDEMVSFTAEWHAPEIVAAFAALNALSDPDGRIDR